MQEITNTGNSEGKYKYKSYFQNNNLKDLK
jgi:hypothetical protein